MRICIVVNIFPTISETFIINKVVGLASLGHKVEVVCMEKKMYDNTFINYNLASKNIRIHQLRLTGSIANFLVNCVKNPSLFFKSFSTNTNTFKKNYIANFQASFFNSIKYDVIHFEFSGLAVSYLPIFHLIKGKKIVSCRGTAEKVKPLTDDKRKKALEKLFQQVHAIHCVSNDMKQTILPYGAKENKIFINTPAIDIDFFSTNKIHKQKPLLRIISVGRLTFQKGYVTAMQVIHALAKLHTNFEYLIIGDGNQYEELKLHIHQLGIEKYVKLVGKRNRDEVKEMLADADIFLLTSYLEGLPNVALEAMAMQLPVVSTRCGGVEEAITNEEDGFVADVYDVQGLVNYLIPLVTSAELRTQIGVAARKKVASNFTINRQLQIFENAYRGLF
jgi:colanic acid/amylovoran biosynthesis glycosyltransferase